MLRLYWYGLDLDRSQCVFLNDVFAELSQLLKRPPISLDAEIKVLPDKIAKEVGEDLRHPPEESETPFFDCVEVISWRLSELRDGLPLLVCCQPDANIAKACQAQSPLAHWGCCCGCQMGAVYKLDNKYIIWHEALHLWGAKDCYSEDDLNGTTCELEKCIMQYAPTEETVAQWPFLCERNVELIRKYSVGGTPAN